MSWWLCCTGVKKSHEIAHICCQTQGQDILWKTISLRWLCIDFKLTPSEIMTSRETQEYIETLLLNNWFLSSFTIVCLDASLMITYRLGMLTSRKCPMRILGWYHSHPHITVWPSHVGKYMLLYNYKSTQNYRIFRYLSNAYDMKVCPVFSWLHWKDHNIKIKSQYKFFGRIFVTVFFDEIFNFWNVHTESLRSKRRSSVCFVHSRRLVKYSSYH